MPVLAVVLQVVGAVAAIIAAGMFFDSVWAAILVAAALIFFAGEALERQ